MSHFIPQEFHYRLDWRTHGVRPGAHASKTLGGNADFRGFSHFLSHPDPKRIDVRRSLMMVPQTLMVRTFNERNAITVCAMIDASSSMAFAGDSEKWQMVAEIASAIAWSAARQGDAFGLLTADDALRPDLSESVSSRRGMAQQVYQKIHSAQLKPQASASALPKLAAQLSSKKSLVFLISDFHLDMETLKTTLQSMAIHDVVPIVLWDAAEYENIPAWGWARVRDMETGVDAALFLRPKLLLKIRDSYSLRRSALIQLCRKSGVRKPFFVGKSFNATQLSQHLLGLG
ncbi:MAG: DUF58 domain-containing protein [Pseudomonadota bacterium]